MLSYTHTRKHIEAQSIRCASFVDEALERIHDQEDLNAFVEIFDDDARRRAGEIDDWVVRKGVDLPPLAGMIIGIKDNICIENRVCSAASRMLREYVSPYSATVVQRLQKAGAIIVGRTNMDEFAMGSSSETSCYGAVKHPLDPRRVPGGSSGGSAVAVAAGMVHGCLGSDTAGSVRLPAAFTGIVGLKPTYGRVSRHGLVAFASSCDQIGPMAFCVEDAARLLSVISGRDEHDVTTSEEPAGDFLSMSKFGVKGRVIGIPEEYLPESLSPALRKAMDGAASLFAEAGACVEPIKLPLTRYVVPSYYILGNAEASSNLSRYDGIRYGYSPEEAGLQQEEAGFQQEEAGFQQEEAKDLEQLYIRSRSESFGMETKRRIMLGTFVLSSGYYRQFYDKAMRVRSMIRSEFLETFKTVDFLLTPTTSDTAFRIGEKLQDPLQMYLSDVFTGSANLAGLPAVSVPAGADGEGLPIGLQLMAAPFAEGPLLAAATVLEGFIDRMNLGSADFPLSFGGDR